MADTRTTVVFRAVDQATPTFAFIGERFKAFKNIVNNEQFKGWNRNFRVFQGSLSKVGSQISSAASTLAVPFSMAAGAIGFSLGNVVKNYMDVGDALDKAMIRTGASAENLQTLHYAASMAGSSAETMNASLIKLNQNMANAAAGKNKDLSELFDKLGISLKNSDGSLRTATEVLPAFADAIQSVQDPALRTRMVVAAFGRQGAELIPTLEGGSEGLRQAAERAKQLGLVMSEKQIKDAAAFGDALSEVGMVASAFGNQIGASVAPALTALSGKLTDVIAKNREVFNERLTALATSFAGAIEKIDFAAVVDGLFKFGERVAYVFDKIGGLEGVLTAFGVVLGSKVLSGVASFAGDLFTLGKSAFALVPAIKAVGVAIAGAMGPIGWIGAAVAAAAGLIIANWDTIGPIVSETWETIKTKFSDFCNWVGGFFTDFWENLDFSSLMQAAFDLSPAVMAFNLLPESWQNVLKDLLSRVENFFKDLWGRFTGFFKNLDFTSMLPDSVKSIAQKVGSAFDGVKDKVTGAVKSILPLSQTESRTAVNAVQPAVVGGPMPMRSATGIDATGIPTFNPTQQRAQVSGELKIKVEAANGATAEVEKVSTSDGWEMNGDVGTGRIGAD